MAKVSTAADRAKSLLSSLGPMDFASRMEQLRVAMGSAGCTALLVSKVVNIQYLTSFSGSAAMLLVRPDRTVLVTDGRYGAQAAEELRSGGVEAEVQAVPGAGQGGALALLTSDLRSLGIEADHVSWARHGALKRSWARGKELVPTSGIVEGLRRLKSPAEVARIAAAAAVADEAFARILPLLEECPTEVEVAVALEAEMRRIGADGVAFGTIVAAGTNAAMAHHNPSRRKARSGELVVVDFGARVDGYCSDVTRTVVAGAPAAARRVPAALRRVASVVLASQDAGLSAVRAGVPASEVDRACREVAAAAGLGAWFVHPTGHGVGLEIHEAPSVASSSVDILCPGEVVTVEPGVYIPGLGGARTEDTVLVTEAGCEVLTLAPKASQAAAAAAGCFPPR